MYQNFERVGDFDFLLLALSFFLAPEARETLLHGCANKGKFQIKS
jgi:hypothetical protein